MSLPHLYVDSNGEVADFTKPYRKLQAKIGREQRNLSHMLKESSNYKKQCVRIAKLHTKAKHQRNDMLHKLHARFIKYPFINIFEKAQKTDLIKGMIVTISVFLKHSN